MNYFLKRSSLAAISLILLLFLTSNLSAQPVGDFELLVYDVQTEEVHQVTDYYFAGFFNPSFSNNGETIVCDAVFEGGGQVAAYFDVATGAFLGQFPGNDASWSPNGNLIVFDKWTPQTGLALFLVPPFSEYPTLLRTNGVDGSWSPNSKHVAFVDLADGSVKTIDVATGEETMVVPFGANPAWSPNGQYIAFTDYNNLFKVKVNNAGEPIGPVTQITFDPPGTYNQQPSWSNNSQTLVFHSNLGGADFDLWTIPANGGAPALLTGMPGAGDYDPCYSKNGRYVAYAGVPAIGERSLEAASEVTPQFQSAQNFPNPFREMTTIPVELQENTSIDLRIYDSKGTLVRILASGEFAAGTHFFEWNGTGPSGQLLSGGVYTYSLKVGERMISRQMMLLDR